MPNIKHKTSNSMRSGGGGRFKALISDKSRIERRMLKPPSLLTVPVGTVETPVAVLPPRLTTRTGGLPGGVGVPRPLPSVSANGSRSRRVGVIGVMTSVTPGSSSSGSCSSLSRAKGLTALDTDTDVLEGAGQQFLTRATRGNSARTSRAVSSSLFRISPTYVARSPETGHSTGGAPATK